MSTKQKIILSVVILILVNFLLVIIFADNGLVDYRLLQEEKQRLIERNEELTRENMVLYREINRLKHDLNYLENIARHELGLIGKDELILKFNGKKRTGTD